MARSLIDTKHINFLRSETQKKRKNYNNLLRAFFNPYKTTPNWNEHLLHSAFLEYAVAEALLQERSFQYSHEYTSDLSRKKESIERRALRLEARLVRFQINKIKINYDNNIYAYFYMKILENHLEKVRENLSEIGYKRDRRWKRRWQEFVDQNRDVSKVI